MVTSTGIATLIIGLVTVGWGLFMHYKILNHIQATEMIWFLFWMYIPIVIISVILSATLEKKEKEVE